MLFLRKLIRYIKGLPIRAFINRAISDLIIHLPLRTRLSRGWPLKRDEKKNLISNLIRQAKCPTPQSGKHVVFWEPGGMIPILTRDAIIATALKLRGVEAEFVVCDGAPSACILREAAEEQPLSLWHSRCPRCLGAYTEEAISFNLSFKKIGDYVTEDRRAELRALAQKVPVHEIATFRYREVEVGKLAVYSVQRYLKRGLIQGNDEVVREYLYAGLVNTEAAIAVIEHLKPDCMFMSHGCYVDYGAALSVAMHLGVPTIVWASAYLQHCSYMHMMREPGDRSFQTLGDEAWRQRREQPLTREENERLDKYLITRYTTDIAFDLKLSSRPESPNDLFHKLNIPKNRPVWCIFAHLNWDNAFTYAPMAFDTVESWIIETIQVLSILPEVTWLIKIHPAEVFLGTAEGIQNLIEKEFPKLPSNIRIIPADSDINIYGLYSILDGGVTVFGTPGLETALLGKPVIVAGESHYVDKGFTYDGLAKSKYLELLRNAYRLPLLSPRQKELARQYAYSYFIQRQIPLRMIKGYSGWGPMDYQKLELLLPGKDPFINFICERIFDGKDFVMDESLVVLSEKLA